VACESNASLRLEGNLEIVRRLVERGDDIAARAEDDHLTVLDWARRAVTGDSELCPWMRGPSGRRVGRVTREVDLVGERSA